MNRMSLILTGLALSCAMPVAAWAHGSMEPRHGGVVQMNGETLFELVREKDGIALYVLDDDEPVVAHDKTARLSVPGANGPRDVEMTPGEGNRFFAGGETLPAGADVGVMVIDKASLTRTGARFIVN